MMKLGDLAEEGVAKCVSYGGQENDLYSEQIWGLAGFICEEVFDDKEHECQDQIYNAICTYYAGSESQPGCCRKNKEKAENGGLTNEPEKRIY